jgi:tetratricopeptide (TPR) repeat protein
MSSLPRTPAAQPSATAALRQRLLGVIARHQRGEIDAAVEGYRAVLAEAPRQFDAWRLLAAALRARGELAPALEAFDRAVALRGDFAEAWFLRGETLAQLGRVADSVQSLLRAVELRPDYAVAWNALGLQRQALQDSAGALAAYDRALALAPDCADFWSNRALSRLAAQRPLEALDDCERALQLQDGSPELWVNRAKILGDLRRHEQALESLDRAVALAPDLAVAWASRAAPLRALGSVQEVLATNERAIALDPRLAMAWWHRGAAHCELGQWEAARADYEEALRLDPKDPQALFNLGLLDLATGNFAAGWAGYEHRQSSCGMVEGQAPLLRPGEDPRGLCIALHAEQGLGDTLQFCRYARLLAQRGARVLLVVPPPLHRLLGALAPGVEVYTTGDFVPAFDRQCRLLSMAYLSQTRLDSVPAQVPYLQAPAESLERWRARLPAALPGQARALRIGLAYSGNPEHGNDRHRSLPLARLATWLASLPAGRFEWHLLQKDLRPDDEALFATLGIVDHRAALDDFAETAALASCLDAVLSVDTSLAHLAGALGKPLFLLLPANPDWRWLLDRGDSPWYPQARLFRQRVLDDWGDPLQCLRMALLELPSPEPVAAASERTPPIPRAAVPAQRTAAAPPRVGREDAQLAALRQAARAEPDNAAAQFNLGLRYLALGRFEQGWEQYEWRVRVPKLFTPMPEGGRYWDGSQPLAGRTLLLCQEQGLGDVIQFCRFVPQLAAQGARVLLGVAPALARLMHSLPGVQQVISGDEAPPPFDDKGLLLSVAQRLGVREAGIPAPGRYLAAPAELVAQWRARLGPARPGRLRVGLAASGSATHANDAQRSLPLARLAQLCRALDARQEGGWEWHLLQKELRPADAAALAEGAIHDHRAQLGDLADTAALIENLDFVISVDTAVAHLAGALGVPQLVLLAADPDWRWQLEREDSPWYPGARLLRQEHPGDWDGPLARAGDMLQAWREQAPARGGAGPLAQLGGTLHRTHIVQPDLAAWLAQAAQQHRRGELAAAIAAYEHILAHDARLFDAQRLLGAARLQAGTPAAALAPLDAALALRSDLAEPWRVRADARRQTGDATGALSDIDRALALQPDDAVAWSHRALICHGLDRASEARAAQERAVRLAPGDPAHRFQRGLLRLQDGEWPQAWEDFEARLQVPALATVPLAGVPVWDVQQPLAGRSLLLTCEQGQGDTVQFCRLAVELAQRGARVVLGVPAGLRDLLRSLDERVQVVGEGDRLPALDLQCTLLSLPQRLGLTPQRIPAAGGYLRAPADRVQAWRSRLGLDADPAGPRRLRIGLACSGQAAHVNDARRSLPLERFAFLADLPIEWHLVQSELRPADAAGLTRLGLHDHRAQLRDWSETAALLQCLDALVSVDTAVAHVAGALGRPLYLLLARPADWRWGTAGAASPWYASAQLLRQAQPGDWAAPLQQLRRALVALASAAQDVAAPA